MAVLDDYGRGDSIMLGFTGMNEQIVGATDEWILNQHWEFSYHTAYL